MSEKKGRASRVWSSGRNRSCLCFVFFSEAVIIAHACFFLLLERCDRYFLGYIPKICMKSLALEGEACAAWQIPGFGLCKRLTVF